MIKYILIIFLATSSLVLADECCCWKEKRIPILEISQFEHCEGEDSANYTFISDWTENSKCELESADHGVKDDVLIACQHNDHKIANSLRTLARSINPAGAYYQLEALYLVVQGKDSLEGKYVYLKELGLRDSYLKKCSSILGYSYVSSKQSILLINKKLDLNVFIDPIGAFEVFKKSCSTICKGITYNV